MIHYLTIKWLLYLHVTDISCAAVTALSSKMLRECLATAQILRCSTTLLSYWRKPRLRWFTPGVFLRVCVEVNGSVNLQHRRAHLRDKAVCRGIAHSLMWTGALSTSPLSGLPPNCEWPWVTHLSFSASVSHGGGYWFSLKTHRNAQDKYPPHLQYQHRVKTSLCGTWPLSHLSLFHPWLLLTSSYSWVITILLKSLAVKCRLLDD